MATRLPTPSVCTASAQPRSALGHAAGVAALRRAGGHCVVGRGGGLSLPLSPLPLAVHDALECALGLQHVAPPRAGPWGRVLWALSRAAGLAGELHPPLPPLARSGDHMRPMRPVGHHLIPTPPGAVGAALPSPPRPRGRRDRHDNERPMAADVLPTPHPHHPLPGRLQHGEQPPSVTARWGDPPPDRRPTWGAGGQIMAQRRRMCPRLRPIAEPVAPHACCVLSGSSPAPSQAAHSAAFAARRRA
jgi:hypothetical protein